MMPLLLGITALMASTINVQDPKTARVLERWPSGKVRCVRLEYLDASGFPVLHGPYRERHENGKLAVEGEYAHGKRVGEWIVRDPNGAIEEQGEYRDGFRTGTWESWLELSGKREKFETVYEILRIEQTLTGSVWTGAATRGNREGEWFLLRANGSVLLEVRYPDGRLPLAASYHYPDGLREDDWYRFEERPVRTPEARLLDLSALPPPSTSADAEAQLRAFLDDGTNAKAAQTALLEQPSAAMATALRSLLSADLTQEDSQRRAGRVHDELLARLCGAAEPWPMGKDEDARLARARLIRKWYGLWELAREGPHLWEWELCAEMAEPDGPGARLLEDPPLPMSARDQKLGAEFQAVNTDPNRRLYGARDRRTEEQKALAARAREAALEAATWLAAQQDAAGAWPVAQFGGESGAQWGVQASCLLALTLENQPAEGEHAAAVARGVRWLLHESQQQAEAAGGVKAEPILQNALVLQAVAEVVLRTPSPRLWREAEKRIHQLWNQRLADGSWPAAPSGKIGDAATTLVVFHTMLAALDLHGQLPGDWDRATLAWLEDDAHFAEAPPAKPVDPFGPRSATQLEAYRQWCRLLGGAVDIRDDDEVRRILFWTVDLAPALEQAYDPLTLLLSTQLSAQILPHDGDDVLQASQRLLLARAESESPGSRHWTAQPGAAGAGGDLHATALGLLTLGSQQRYPIWALLRR